MDHGVAVGPEKRAAGDRGRPPADLCMPPSRGCQAAAPNADFTTNAKTSSPFDLGAFDIVYITPECDKDAATESGSSRDTAKLTARHGSVPFNAKIGGITE
jgi:hypothetical protein